MKKENGNLSIENFIKTIVLSSVVLIAGCSKSSPVEAQDNKEKLSQDSLLTLVQHNTFQYFWDGAEPNSGLARERYHVDGVYPENDKNVVTTGGSGFGIMAIIVGMERGFITYEEGLDRFEKIVSFLEDADRFHGVWPHWMYGESGKVKPFGKKDNGGDLVETAFMAQGLIAARQYLRDGNERARELASKMDELWREIEWDWYRRGGDADVLYWHWSPDYGWEMDFPLEGYNETMITYIMAASSPTHDIPAKVYHEGWARGGDIDTSVTTYDYELQLKHNGAYKYGGPLFWAHYSWMGLDPRGLEDQYANYWKENVNHTLINRQWCVLNPKDYAGYGEDLWGLTASYTASEDGGVGYAAHHPGEDLGVITPTAALSSFPYTPDESMKVIENLYYNYGNKVFGKYGFYDAMSPEKNFFPKRYLAIDQGPIVVMIENHRSNLIWDLFMSAPEIKKGLNKLGFESPHL